MRQQSVVFQAMEKALEVRQLQNIKLITPICIYDVADALEVEVRFADVASLEGMYSQDPRPTIIISSLRPPGRQVFTCAHELGHHVFNHGARFDELSDSPLIRNPQEFLVDCFAGFLLMPKSAVSRAFKIRGWIPQSSTPIQVFTIAGLFGVGYTTLIHHMTANLNLLSQSQSNKLLQFSPKFIRSQVVDGVDGLVIVDGYWTGEDRAVDIQVGDCIQLPNGVIHEGSCIQLVNTINSTNHSFYQGVTPGIGRAFNEDSGWSVFIRVSRRNYNGRSTYRHLEDQDDE